MQQKIKADMIGALLYAEEVSFVEALAKSLEPGSFDPALISPPRDRVVFRQDEAS